MTYMGSLTPKRFGRRTYYYYRECARVDGRPKIVRQSYLGTADEILSALESGRMLAPLRDATVKEFGALAALYDFAQRLQFVDIVDRHVPKRKSDAPSVGQYLLLAALNRAVAPTSKAAFARWYETTALSRWIPADASQLTSQRFWDNMDRVKEEAIEAIQEEIATRLVRDFGVDTAALFYDATNFFTFIDSFNERCDMAQRGKNKQGHNELRQLGLALLVSRDEIPLFHRLYPGNQADVTAFRVALDVLQRRYREILQTTEDVTLVFDKGNNAKDVIKSFKDTPYHFVGALVPTQHPDLLAVPIERFRAMRSPRLEGAKAYRTRKKVFAAERTVVVVFNPALYDAQVKTLNREVEKRRARLQSLQRRLRRWEEGKVRFGKPPTREDADKAVAKILQGRHMKDLLATTITAGKRGRPKLSWRFDTQSWKRLDKTLLGKSIYFTDQDAWSDEEIATAYRGQYHVENAFRRMKNPRNLPFRPQYHWTDQKLKVHAFYCVSALLLCGLLRRELARQGLDLSVLRMLELLGGIQEVQVLEAGPRGRPRTHRTLTRVDTEQKRLFEILQLGRYEQA
jgi:transposase